MNRQTTILFRPVGQKELDLIVQSDYSSFPPRLEAQPFFYPVLNLEYAIQIARDWNTRDAASDFVGYVTRFRVFTDYLDGYDIQIVGAASVHREYWIPAEELPEFNRNIAAKIEVIARFEGTSGG
ncbi:MAG: hypothetical protein KC777_12715 [Cyanobacteria bacterium HKST-UBA02]|nr:hypothetical protein [Cyanobacteria bacterium HKST-UBA02]